MNEIYDTDGSIVAAFEDYKDAVACLPAMARILKRVLRLDIDEAEPCMEIPRGAFVSNFNGGECNVIEARP